MAGYRGRERGEGQKLIKAIVTLPKSLMTELDVVVAYYKQEDRSFNRSALIQEALAMYLEGIDDGK